MVSIVITAYNVEPWIEEAVRSACSQTFKDIEIIIVEDCSTDRTRDILWQIRDWRVKTLYNPRNMGAGASRRRGIEAASGEYILLLDGDDWLDEGFVEALYSKAVETGADIVSGGITVEHEDGARETSSYGNCIVQGKEKLKRFWGEKVVFMNNKLIRRELHSRVPYCKRRFIEDTPVIVPMLHLAGKVAYTDNTGYHYRMRSSSLTHTATQLKKALFRALCAEDLISFFEAHDKSVLQELKLGETYSNCLFNIKRCCPDAAMVEPFKEEWIEYTTKMIARLGE